MPNSQSKSIKDLATRVCLWAGILTSAFILIFAVFGISETYQSSLRAENERLKLLLPIVSSSISQEVHVGDTRSRRGVISFLTTKYNLHSVEISSSPPANCNPRVSSAQALIGNDELCVFKEISGQDPDTFVTIRSEVPMDIRTSMISILWAWIPLVIIGFFIGYKIRKGLTDTIVRPIEELAKNPETWKPAYPHVVLEAINLHERLIRYITERDREKKEAERLKIDASLVQWATQVAHDIRSPLTALNKATEDLTMLPEDRRVLLRSAVARIQDIANHLIQKSKPSLSLEGPATIGSDEACSKELLPTLIDSLVSEKRMQYQSNLSLEILTRVDNSAYGVFANIQPIEFKRLLSNLINNAVEAIVPQAQGLVEITLSASKQEIRLRVTDNGKGIPARLLPALMNKGATFGKEGGSGFGLYHAKNAIESWGGTVKIESEVDKGTTVILTIAKADPPEWFAANLRLDEAAIVVILDDDPTIHQVWDGRFQRLRNAHGEIAVVHLSTPSQFETWVNENSPLPKTALFLIDYELIGTTTSGLDLIERHKIGAQSILVTSRYEDCKIREQCRHLGLKLIPKTMAGFVPLSVESKKAVLIDNDPIVHRLWNAAAMEAGKTLFSFSNAEDFLKNTSGLEPGTPIYLDSHLGGNVRGETFAPQIYAAGFTEIYIVTGYNPQTVIDQSEIRAILGKNPPW